MAYTPYYPGGWQSGEQGGTPITPAALNNMETGIGAALTAGDVNIVDSNVAIPEATVTNGTFQTMATFTPSETGNYLILVTMTYGTATAGNRILLVDTTETSTNTSYNSVLATGRSVLQRTSVYVLTANDTVYIRAYQNSGSDMSVSGAYRVIRLK